MPQLNFHTNAPYNAPPAGVLPIIQRFVHVYKLWHEFKDHIPKKSRYTLGAKIDSLFLAIVELLFTASYLPRLEKPPLLHKANSKLDVLKFFLQVAWELKALDNKKYITLSESLNEIGRMLGGWRKGLESKTLAA